LNSQLAQGQVQAERALELDDDNPLTQAAAATAAMVLGDNESCVTNAASARELGFSNIVSNLEGICLARLGQFDAASAALKVAHGPVIESSALKSLAEALTGADNLAAAAQQAMTDESAWRMGPWAIWLAAAAGEPDKAFTFLQQWFDEAGYFPLQLLWTPEAQILRRDARFLELMQDYGVSQLWRNELPDRCKAADEGRFSCS